MKNKALIYISLILIGLSTLKLGTHPAFLCLAIGFVSILYRNTMKFTHYIKRRIRT